MTEEFPESARQAFEYHDAFRRDGNAFTVETTAFEGRVSAVEGPEYRTAYTVSVRVPTLAAVTADEVGEAVAEGWFDTLQRRLEDAPQTTRADVELETFDVEQDGEDVYVTFGFEWGSADQAAAIAKAFVEYVEGTYVEGVIPGYDYESPVSDLIDTASQEGGGGGGTPL
ncbi:MULTISPECIES: DUF5813 family protein [Salinibaculum]|uniref:DUF5813 family protein n=1 Tax=Salinibaculum TaxID=2732368 RepID=UPI0030D18B38